MADCIASHLHALHCTHWQAMLKDKLKSSDWEATCDAVEEAVARESYMLWLKEQEDRGEPSSSSSFSKGLQVRERERELAQWIMHAMGEPYSVHT